MSTLGQVAAAQDPGAPATALQSMTVQEGPDAGQPLFTPPVLAALLVFFLYALQCMSTVGALRRESGSWRWPAIAFGYMFGLAWVMGSPRTRRRGGDGMTAVAPVALHPEAVPGEPLEVRWILPPGTLPFVGAVRAAPPALQALVDDGVLTGVVVDPDAVRTRIAPGLQWRAVGTAVRDAVASGAADPGRLDPGGAGDHRGTLRAAVEQVLAGEVGDYVRSHGGSLELVAVEGDRVAMRFSGACAHCPASDPTLTGRFEAAVRARFPGLAGIDTTRTPAPEAGPRFIGIPLLRRR